MPGPSMSPMPGGPMGDRAMSPMPGAGMYPSPLPAPHGAHLAPRGRSRASTFLIGGAVLVLVAAAIASIVLAASGG